MASIPPIEVSVKVTEMPEDAAPSRYQAKFWVVYRDGSSETAIGAETLEELFLAADCRWPLDPDCKSEGTLSERLAKARDDKELADYYTKVYGEYTTHEDHVARYNGAAKPFFTPVDLEATPLISAISCTGVGPTSIPCPGSGCERRVILDKDGEGFCECGQRVGRVRNIEVVSAGVDPSHQTSRCDHCGNGAACNALIQTCDQYRALKLCDACCKKAGNSVR